MKYNIAKNEMKVVGNSMKIKFNVSFIPSAVFQNRLRINSKSKCLFGKKKMEWVQFNNDKESLL